MLQTAEFKSLLLLFWKHSLTSR